MKRFSRNRHGGRLVICTAADRQRPRVELNRYRSHGEIVGICFYPGGQRFLSWVWPVILHVRPQVSDPTTRR